MKKLLLSLAIGALTFQVFAQAPVSFSTTSYNWYPVILSNRASVYQVDVVAGTQPVTVKLYNWQNTNDLFLGPIAAFNVSNSVPAYPTRTSYATNYVTSNVDFYGNTNWYTNAGIWSTTITNAASTNAMTPLLTFIAAASTYTVNDVDALFERGIIAVANTNATVVIRYRR